MKASEFQLGIAEGSDDLRYVIRILSAAGLTLLAEDGGGPAAYPFSIAAHEWSRAREVISAAHRFRSGDLRVFLFETQMPREQRWDAREREDFLSWCNARRREDVLKRRPSPDPDFDELAKEEIANAEQGKRWGRKKK